jgi:hypothetical protein
MAQERKLWKPKPSAHQKQIRFFTILFTVLACLLMGGLLWLVNYSSHSLH